MTRNHVLKVIAWMRQGGVVVDELKFFQTAYYDLYHEAHIRCSMCYLDYRHTGHVPAFVRQFIKKHLILRKEN